MADCVGPINVDPAPGCTNDFDCPQGTVCVNGECVPKEANPPDGLTAKQGLLLVGVAGTGLWWYSKRGD